MTVNELVLRELHDGDEAAFLAGVESWRGEELSWHTFDWRPGMAFAEHLETLRKQRLGLDLAPNRVAATLLYGFVDGTIVGRVSGGLDACRALGLTRILVTASDNNAPSCRIIEKLGGILENTVDHDGVLKRRYWIDLEHR
jgi:predicted acetyltransferase